MDKKASDSYTEQVQLLTKANMNGYNRLFGGTLMEWIDIVAGVTARRHSGCNVTTVVVDTLQFKKPAYQNEVLSLKGRVTYVGRTSMEIQVKTFVENMDGTKRLINEAYVVMVALDENQIPTEVPGLILETEEDKALWEAGKKRNELRKMRMKEHY